MLMNPIGAVYGLTPDAIPLREILTATVYPGLIPKEATEIFSCLFTYLEHSSKSGIVLPIALYNLQVNV